MSRNGSGPSRTSDDCGRTRRQPTMEDVAREAGVSRSLVSLVMREQPNVSAARRARVLEAAARLGYRPNAMARSLASQRTRAVGVIIDDLRNPFFAEIVSGIEQLASETGYQVLLATGGRQADRERTALAALLEYRVDGIILVSPRLPSADIVDAGREVPLVVTGREVRGATASFLVTNERSGVRAVLDHLVELGHERITHLDGGHGAGGSQRRANYLRGMQRRGLGDHAQVIHGDFTEESGRRATEALLASGFLPTAIFAANDLVAAGVLGALHRAGVEVPREVSLVGFDNIAIADFAHMSLTTVDQPRLAMGRAALEMLIERIAGSHQVELRTIEPALIIRSTTGPPRELSGPQPPAGASAEPAVYAGFTP